MEAVIFRETLLISSNSLIHHSGFNAIEFSHIIIHNDRTTFYLNNAIENLSIKIRR